MRIAVFVLALIVAGCKSKPADPVVVVPNERLQPLHPEVLRPRPDPKGAGIEVDGSGGKPALQLRQDRVVLIPDQLAPAPVEPAATLQSQARDLYLRGYQLKENDPKEAISLFKQVLAIAPPDDEYHQKAKSQLERMSH